jgi:tetratricopeptide (TPR) repeat protein
MRKQVRGWHAITRLCMVAAVGCGARDVSGSRERQSLEQDLAVVVRRYENGDLRGAISHLQHAARQYPRIAQIHFMLGNGLYRLGDLNEAAKEYKRSLELRPGDLEAYVSRGFALYELTRCIESVEAWSAAVAADPEEPLALARAALAVGLKCVGRVEEARDEYAKAVKLDRRYASPRDLTVDIRWKRSAVAALEQLQHTIPR